MGCLFSRERINVAATMRLSQLYTPQRASDIGADFVQYDEEPAPDTLTDTGQKDRDCERRA